MTPVQLALLTLAVTALLIAAILLAPRCGPHDPDGRRIGSVLISGCDRSGQ